MFANQIGNSLEFARPGVPPEVEVVAHTEGEMKKITVREDSSGKAVHRMGGTIWVESTLGKGAAFWFTLQIP